MTAVERFAAELGYNLFLPLLPFRSGPDESAETLPAEIEDIPNEQLAQCQTIFEACEVRREKIEQKAQWTFTAIAVLTPALASVLVFLLRDPAFKLELNQPALVLLCGAVCALVLCLIGILRALAVRPYQALYVQAVIDENCGAFRKYNNGLHAKGLLYCAMHNTVTNDHIAQFVKSGHILLSLAVALFVAALMVIVAEPQTSVPVIS